MAEKYTSPFKYRCDRNPKHWLEGPKPLTRCPIVWQGTPCGGTLTRMTNENRKASHA